MKKKSAKKAYLTTACDHDCNGGPQAILRGMGLVGRRYFTCGNNIGQIHLRKPICFDVFESWRAVCVMKLRGANYVFWSIISFWFVSRKVSGIKEPGRSFLLTSGNKAKVIISTNHHGPPTFDELKANRFGRYYCSYLLLGVSSLTLLFINKKFSAVAECIILSSSDLSWGLAHKGFLELA